MKKHTTKRIISLIIAAATLLTAMPIAVVSANFMSNHTLAARIENGVIPRDTTTLSLRLEKEISDLTPLIALQSLEELDLRGCWKVTDLSPLSQLPNLRVLHAGSIAIGGGRNSVLDLQGLSGATSLVELNLDGNGIVDFTPLGTLVNLKRLNIGRTNADNRQTPLNLNGIGALVDLEELIIDQSAVADLSPLSTLANLQVLQLWYNWTISDLSPLRELTSLRELNLSGNNVSDLSPLRNLQSLEVLNLSGNKVSDLSPLAGLTKLKDLDLAGNEYEDLSPLKNVKSLRNLNIVGSNALTLEQVKELEAALRGCKISSNFGTFFIPDMGIPFRLIKVANGHFASHSAGTYFAQSYADLERIANIIGGHGSALPSKRSPDSFGVTEDFFDDNVLIIIEGGIDGASTQTFNSVMLEDDKLVVDMTLVPFQVAPAWNATWIYTLQVSKSDIGGATSAVRRTTIPKVTISFDSTGGSPVESVQVNINTSFNTNILPIPMREGYVFNGWFQENGWQISGNAVGEDTVLYARWIVEPVTTFRMGHVLGNDVVTVEDALEILKYIVGIDSLVARSARAFRAALITGGETPGTADALEILKFLVGMESKLCSR